MGVNRANEQNAIQLMKEHISSEWIVTDMGSGCRLVLKDTYGSVIHEHKYLDIFELPEEAPESESQEYYRNKVADSQSEYEEWKENFQADSLEQFIALCEVKYLYFFL